MKSYDIILESDRLIQLSCYLNKTIFIPMISVNKKKIKNVHFVL